MIKIIYTDFGRPMKPQTKRQKRGAVLSTVGRLLSLVDG